MKKWGFFFLLILFFCVTFLNELNNLDSELPDGLYHVVSERSEQLIQQAKAQGIEVMITDDFRSFEEQNHLYTKGRTTEGEIITHA